MKPAKTELPTRPDYVVIDWYLSQDVSGFALDFKNTAITSNITLYAKWAESSTVTYNKNANDATAGSKTSEKLATGSTATEPTEEEQPTRTGYVFTGWYQSEDGSGNPFDFSTSITTDVVLYAKWQINSIS